MIKTIPMQMPPDIAPLFERLTDQLAHLHVQWRIFRQMFGTNAARVQTLNAVAPTAARVIQDVLQDEVYLGLTRLTDRAVVAGKKTLSFARIAAMFGGAEYASIHRALDATLTKATKRCSPFRKEHRNPRIAHNDLKGSLKATYDRPSRKTVDEALAACGEFMNVIFGYFNDGPMAFEYVHFLV